MQNKTSAAHVVNERTKIPVAWFLFLSLFFMIFIWAGRICAWGQLLSLALSHAAFCCTHVLTFITLVNRGILVSHLMNPSMIIRASLPPHDWGEFHHRSMMMMMMIASVRYSRALLSRATATWTSTPPSTSYSSFTPRIPACILYPSPFTPLHSFLSHSFLDFILFSWFTCLFLWSLMHVTQVM